jgi:hypothetical protein
MTTIDMEEVAEATNFRRRTGTARFGGEVV